MPFVRKTDSQGSQPPTDTRKLFIGRTGELLFFVQNILKPEEPTHNIISIWGQGGVGKSTLLSRFIDEARSANFKDYCLIAIVDERQTTSTSIMEKFADQLHVEGEFGKALKQHKESVRKLQTEQETLQDAVLSRVPDFAGAAAEMVPFVGPLLREGAKATAGLYLDKRQKVQGHRDVEILEDPLDDLTRAFVDELNRITDTHVSLSSHKVKNRRVILLFDTFEQLASEAVPWLLNYFLPANIKSNVVLVIAGRDPIERSIPDDIKRWLPYCDNETIYWIPLNSFTEDETRAYLVKRDITDPDRIATIWQLSQGLPLYLSLLTSNPCGKVDPTADVVANFLKWIPKEEQIKRQLALDASLFSRPFNLDDLEAFSYVPEQERSALCHWLIGQPFVRSQDGRFSYHDLAKELFSHHLYQRSQKAYYATRKALADHYERLLRKIEEEGGEKLYRSSEWLDPALASVYQLFFLPDEASHFKAIEQILSIYKHTNKEQDEEIAGVLRKLSKEQITKRANPSAILRAKQILQIIEANGDSQESLVAINSLLEELINKPSFPRGLLALIYRKRGRAYSSLKNYQQAIVDFDCALEFDPNYTFAYVGRGWAYNWLKGYQQAIADFDRALQLDPQCSSAYNGRGWSYLYLTQYQQAKPDFDRALELNPNVGGAYNGRGIIYRALKEHWLAKADFDCLIKMHPQNVWGYIQHGRTCTDLKEYQQAIADFERALELDPDYTFAYRNRGWVYYWLKEYQRALADFERALELDPNYTEAYYGRGWAYSSLKYYQQAIVDFDHALALDPNFTKAYCGRGWVYHELKEFQQAIVDFNRALELDPKDAWVYQCRGRTYYALKNYEQAIADFNRALALNPDYGSAYYYRGYTYLWLKDIKQAEDDFTRSWELVPSSVQYGWMVQWTAICQGKSDSAVVAQLEAIAVIDPQQYSAYSCRGTVQYLRGCSKEAIAELEQAIQLEPERWSAYFWKGMTCASLGSDEDAMAAIQKALELKLPPVLLTPLSWIEQDRPDFYQKYVVPLLARYDLA